MLRSLVLLALSLSSAFAALWPEKLGQYERISSIVLDVSAGERAQSDEYGLEAGERADYSSFQVEAWRYKDPTGAYAASLEASNPPKARVGNYLISCQGTCPKNLDGLADAALPKVSHGSIPILEGYLPARNRVARSERYILGPVGLRANAPQIPAATAAFDFGTEAIIARYHTRGAEQALGIFSFPSPGIARQQLPKFQAIAGAEAKRTGPFVAVVFGPGTDQAAALTLLSGVNYAGSVSANETPPLEIKPETAGQMLVAIITLAGLVLAFCLFSGLAVGGILFVARKFGYSGAEGSLITLNLSGK